MDYNLNKIAIIISIVMVLGIVGVVLLVNYDKETKPEEPVEEVVEGDSEEQKLGVLSGQIGNDLYGFMDDDSFFDGEVSVLEQLIEQSQKLVLDMISVERNIRIKVKNYRGEIILGQEFKVILNDKTEYIDEDKDGIIEISNLQPGEYDVRLMPVEDYVVPAIAEIIMVKASVEYIPINDIGLFVKEEREVHILAEESSFIAANRRASEEQITTLDEIKDRNTIGVTLSSRNAMVDWAQLKEEGIDFVILRVGYRGNETASIIADSKFDMYATAAIKAGISVGVVFESQAVNKLEAVEEASFVLEAIDNHYLSYPIFLDMQGAGVEGRNESLTAGERTDVAIAFNETIMSAGYASGIYAASYQLEENFNMEYLTNYHIWMGEYQKAPSYDSYYDMWQLTANGRVMGVAELVQISIAY